MDKAIPALEYLSATDRYPVRPVCALFGVETFLKRQALLRLREAVLGSDEGDFSLTTFDGDDAAWKDVLGELTTMAMFGSGQRLVVVDEADDFVTRWRPNLEDYAARPASTGVLVLVLASFPSNTRLYKAVVASGLAIDCAAPKGNLGRWLVDWAKRTHDLALPLAAAEVLVELVGPELGLLDQELAKLSAGAGPDRKVSAATVSQMVGGWRTRTTWDMLDAALDGNVGEALTQLDRLLLSGETAVGLLGQIAASLRRLAAATRLVLQAEAAGRRANLRNVLEQCGVRAFVLEKTERQLRRLGRSRGSLLYRWLLQTDLALKGDSQLSPRMVMERLIVRLAAPEQSVRN